jgi:hypothetical protein
VGSVRRRGAVVRVTLEGDEAGLLVSLVSQVSALLAGHQEPQTGESDSIEGIVAAMSTPVSLPEGPILERLLPDGYRGDPEAAEEFRRLTDVELRATKRAALQQILDDVAAAGDIGSQSLRIGLRDEAASIWLHALADVRLALGTHLEVSEDMDGERAALTPDSPRYAELAIYDWTSWLQDAIVRAIAVD